MVLLLAFVLLMFPGCGVLDPRLVSGGFSGLRNPGAGIRGIWAETG